jgi:hypothetical protein
VFAGGALILVVVVYYAAVNATSDFEDQNVAALMPVTSFDEAQAPISRLGALLGTNQGPWVAIEYRDTHYGLIASSAVAKTSDGRWFQSAKHYCGKFGLFSSIREHDSYDRAVGHFPRLAAADRAASVDEMIEILLELGFVEFEPTMNGQ